MNEPVIIGLRPVSEDREDSPVLASQLDQEEDKQDQVGPQYSYD
jgi:hypothetical protein